MPTAVVCVMGLPGAGKSTLCRSLVGLKAFSSFLRSIVPDGMAVEIEWISFDAIEASLRPRGTVEFDETVWHETRNRAQDIVNQYRSNEVLDNLFRIILLDDNFYYSSMRRRFKPNGIVFLDLEIQACIQQNRNPRDSGSVPEHVITRMGALLDRPKASTCCPVVRVDVSEDAYHAVLCAPEFWISVYNSSSNPATRLQDNPRIITDIEQTLNTFEVKLRKAVRTLVVGNPLASRDMGRISMMKKYKIESLRKILRNPTCDEAPDAADRLECEFIDELIRIV